MKPKKYTVRPSSQIMLCLLFGLVPIFLDMDQVVYCSDKNGYFFFILIPIIVVAVMIIVRKCDYIIIDNETLTVKFWKQKNSIELRNIKNSEYRVDMTVHQMVLKKLFYISSSDPNQRGVVIFLNRYSKKDVREIASLLKIDMSTPILQ